MRLVRHTEDRALLHRRVAGEHLLHFARVDIVSVANDHVACAINDSDVAVVVDHSEVARAKPTVDDDPRGFVRSIQIPHHNVMPSNDELAELAYLQ